MLVGWSTSPDRRVRFGGRSLVGLGEGDHIGLDLAVGYHIIGGGEVVRDRLNGVTGSLALQFGW